MTTTEYREKTLLNEYLLKGPHTQSARKKVLVETPKYYTFCLPLANPFQNNDFGFRKHYNWIDYALDLLVWDVEITTQKGYFWIEQEDILYEKIIIAVSSNNDEKISYKICQTTKKIFNKKRRQRANNAFLCKLQLYQFNKNFYEKSKDPVRCAPGLC